MRQVGVFSQQSDAELFVAYLVVEGVAAHTEQEGEEWIIWVREEDDVARAKLELQRFFRDPTDDRYQNAEREGERAVEYATTTFGQTSDQFLAPAFAWPWDSPRRAPLVFCLAAVCVLVTLWVGAGQNKQNYDLLSFCKHTHILSPTWDPGELEDSLVEIRQGQVWRLVTPSLVQLGALSLVLNVVGLYYFGSLIEAREGTRYTGGLILTIALISNVAQALLETPFFGGMSGVVFGLFGYCWMKSNYDPGAGIRLSRLVTLAVMIAFFVCLSGIAGGVASTAQGVGLSTGAVLAYAPLLLRRTPAKANSP